jgi:hypothetical protein
VSPQRLFISFVKQVRYKAIEHTHCINETEAFHMPIYKVAFFGHRHLDDLNRIDERLMPILHRIIDEQEHIFFLIGRNGEFDEYAASVIKRARYQYGVDNSDLILVLPYPVAHMEDYEVYYDGVFIPDCLEGVHPKAAMTKRNQWMVECADLVIVNVESTRGGAAAAMRYAERLHIPVINLAEAGGDGQKI